MLDDCLSAAQPRIPDRTRRSLRPGRLATLLAAAGSSDTRRATVDVCRGRAGTLIDAWASMKSFQPKDGSAGDSTPPAGRNAERNFRGQKRSNETHASTSDPDAKLYRKGNGQSSRLCFMGHLLMENRNALIVGAALTRAGGTAEGEAALVMLDRREPRRRRTLAADKAYDVAAFVGDLRARNITPHIAIGGNIRVSGRPRRTAIDKRTTRHPGYAVSRRLGKRIEEGFGWIKTNANLAKARHRGLARVGWSFTRSRPGWWCRSERGTRSVAPRYA